MQPEFCKKDLNLLEDYICLVCHKSDSILRLMKVRDGLSCHDGGFQDPERREQDKLQDHNPGLQVKE